MPRPSPSLLAALALSAACGGTEILPVPPPLPKIALPSGASLKPYDAAKMPLARPGGMAAGADGRAWVVLANLDANYAVAAPALLVGAVPSTGAITLVDLGGDDGHACTNANVVRADGGKLLVTCTGSFNWGSGTPELRGRALVEADPATGKVTRRVEAPAGFQPSGVAAAAGKLWVGDTGGARLYSVDRATFTVADGRDAAHPAIDLPCPGSASSFPFVSDVLVVGGDLFALCAASEGWLVRLDAATGAVKGDKVLVGALPMALTLAGDGRIAVINSVGGTLALVTVGAGAMTSQTALSFSNLAALQDVRARGHYLYTVSSGTNTVQKIDLQAAGGPKVVAEVNTGDGSNPWNLVPLDDDQAVVSNNLTNELVGVDFRKGTL